MDKSSQEYKELETRTPAGFHMSMTEEEYLNNKYAYYPCAVIVLPDQMHSLKIWRIDGSFLLTDSLGKILVGKTSDYNKILIRIQKTMAE